MFCTLIKAQVLDALAEKKKGVYNNTSVNTGKEIIKCGKKFKNVLDTFDILMGKS